MKLGIISALAALTVSAQASLVYTFDTDNQGWRRSNFDVTSITLTDVGPASWNSGTYIDAEDFAGWSFHTSPLLSGSFAGSTELSFDFSASVVDATPYPFVVLASSTEAIYQITSVPGDGAFHSYSYDLTSATNWKYGNSSTLRDATLADISNVLGSLQRIGINGDVATGSDYTRVDNVRLEAVPEPMTLSVLGLGLLALARRRSR